MSLLKTYAWCGSWNGCIWRRMHAHHLTIFCWSCILKSVKCIESKLNAVVARYTYFFFLTIPIKRPGTRRGAAVAQKVCACELHSAMGLRSLHHNCIRTCKILMSWLLATKPCLSMCKCVCVCVCVCRLKHDYCHPALWTTSWQYHHDNIVHLDKPACCSVCQRVNSCLLRAESWHAHSIKNSPIWVHRKHDRVC